MAFLCEVRIGKVALKAPSVVVTAPHRVIIHASSFLVNRWRARRRTRREDFKDPAEKA